MTGMSQSDPIIRKLYLIDLLLSALEGSDGPNGVIYAFFMEQGVSFDEYTQLVNTAVHVGLIENTADLLSLTEKGKVAARQIAQLSSQVR